MTAITKPISVLLKEARRNKGVTLDEAYGATKIHPKILHALEEGTTLQLSGVYVKSYIKIYAKYLGISQKELDRYFGSASLKEKEEKKTGADILFKVNKNRIQHLLKLSPVLGPSPVFKIKNLKNIAIIFVFILLSLIFIRYVFRISKSDSVKSSKNTKAAAGTIRDVLSKTKTIEPKRKEAKKESIPNVEDSVKLTIFAEENTWMQVKKDGNVVFKGMLKKSNSETWQAKDKIELQVNNAGTVRLEFNNKILPRIGRKGQSLKSVLFTKEGFSIKR